MTPPVTDGKAAARAIVEKCGHADVTDEPIQGAACESCIATAIAMLFKELEDAMVDRG